MRWLKYLSITVFGICLAAFFCHYRGFFREEDNRGPVINCESEVLEISVGAPEEELLSGVSATDDIDGDVTDSLIVAGLSLIDEEYSRTITYAAFDSSNNVSTYKRTVKYTDYKKPKFSLTKELVIFEGDRNSVLNYVRADDVIDGDISSNIKIVSGFDTFSSAGMYSLVVGVSNSCGDYSEIELLVKVKEVDRNSSSAPEILLNDYLIYLEQGEGFEPLEYIKGVVSKVDGESIDNSMVGINSTVDTSVPGKYIVTYYVNNSLGLMGESNLTVVVE